MAILCRQADAARLDILLKMKDTTRLAVLILATMPIFLGGFVIGTRTRGHGGRRYERRRSRWRSAPRQRACLVLRALAKINWSIGVADNLLISDGPHSQRSGQDQVRCP